jgi:hypothetical protein
MSTAPNSESKRLIVAVAASFVLHIGVAAAYVLVPLLRAWLSPPAPALEFGLGLPEFIDISELPGEDDLSQPEQKGPEEPSPPAPQEPAAPQEPPPPGPNPDTYVEPSTKPVKKPSSAPTSAPASVPSSAPVAASQPGKKKNAVPLNATPLVDVLPTNSKLLLLLEPSVMRKSPRQDVLGAALRGMYDADRTFAGAGLDPLNDAEEIILGTSNPWSLARWTFIVRFRGTEKEQRARIEAAAKKAGDSVTWSELGGKAVAEWTKLSADSDHYAFAFLAPDVLLIAPPPVMKEFLTPKKATPLKKPPTSAPAGDVAPQGPPKRSVAFAVSQDRGDPPAILLAVSDLDRTLPLDLLTSGFIDWGGSSLFPPISLPQAPLYFRAGFEVAEGAKSTFDARFESEEDAADAVRKMPALLRTLSSFAPSELKAPIGRIKFEQDEFDKKLVHADLIIPAEEVALILKGLGPLIMGEYAAPVEGQLEEEKEPPEPAPAPEPSPQVPPTKPAP